MEALKSDTNSGLVRKKHFMLSSNRSHQHANQTSAILSEAKDLLLSSSHESPTMLLGRLYLPLVLNIFCFVTFSPRRGRLSARLAVFRFVAATNKP
jgi:hypothetical protein